MKMSNSDFCAYRAQNGGRGLPAIKHQCNVGYICSSYLKGHKSNITIGSVHINRNTFLLELV